MELTFAQARLSTTIMQSGMTDAELAKVLGVNQSTVSRLRHGKVAKVAKYQRKLDQHLSLAVADRPDPLSELIAMTQYSPALRDALVALRRLMQENA